MFKSNDATYLQRYLSGINNFNNISYYLADFNGDGSVTVQDATAIQKHIAGIAE